MNVLRLIELVTAGSAVAVLYLVVVRALLSGSSASRLPLSASIAGFVIGTSAALGSAWLLAGRDPESLPITLAGFAIGRAILSRSFCGSYLDSDADTHDPHADEGALVGARNAEARG